MKESTKTIIRIAAFIVTVLPYRVRRKGDRREYCSLLFQYTWDENRIPALTIRRNQ